MNVVAIIQARTNSARLPNKVFYKLKGKCLLEHVVLRLKPSRKLNNIVIASTTNPNDDKVEQFANLMGIECYRGSEFNVLDRYYQTAIKYNADIIVRITADDPFKDYRIVDNAIEILEDGRYDFVCNNNPASFPEGLDVEVMTFSALEDSYLNAISDFQKEHVTQYIHQNKLKFKLFNIELDNNRSENRWTIDTIEDFNFASQVYENLYSENQIFLTEQIFQLIEDYPELKLINSSIQRSEMYKTI